MSKYLDAEKLKAVLKAQIKERKEWMNGRKSDRQDQLWADLNNEDMIILSLIASFQQEQQEVDLKKEIECSIRFLNGHHTLENGERWYKGRYEELKDFAHHFWNKGYNARKEERK